MNEKKKKDSKWERLMMGKMVTRMAHNFVMYEFDEIDDFNNFMKSAIRKEQDRTSKCSGQES